MNTTRISLVLLVAGLTCACADPVAPPQMQTAVGQNWVGYCENNLYTSFGDVRHGVPNSTIILQCSHPVTGGDYDCMRMLTWSCEGRISFPSNYVHVATCHQSQIRNFPGQDWQEPWLDGPRSCTLTYNAHKRANTDG